MTTPEDDDLKPRRRWPTYLAMVLVLLAVAYPLSIGPADVVDRRLRNETFHRMGIAFYHPLVIAATATGTSGALDEYMEFCHWVAD